MDGPSNPNYQCDSRPLYDRTWQSSDITPERRLWFSVAIFLVQDVQSAYDAWRNSTNGHTRELRESLLNLIDEAMSDHMKDICDWIDIDHEFFVEHCQRISEGTLRAPAYNRNFY